MTPTNVSPSTSSLPVAKRVRGFSYAIRNIALEAQRVERAGRTVRYLNVGNPPAFGFQPPEHMIAAVERAMRSGHNGYGPSSGVESARVAVADEYTGRGWPVSPDRVCLTAGTSEAIELALDAIVDEGGDVLVPQPVYPLYTAVLAKIGARAVYYRTDPSRGWVPDMEHLARVITPATRAIVVTDPNNPTGATYPASVRKELVAFTERHGIVMLADEVYGDLGFDGSVPPLGSIDPDAAVISLSSLSKGYLAPGWRTGWLALGRSPRLDELAAAIGRLADGRLCSTVPMQYAVTAALTGDRSHQARFRAALRERATITSEAMNAIPGMTCVAPTSTFYAMPKLALPAGTTDEDYVLGLLRATGVLLVHGSGFGMPAEDGYMRIVFLAAPDDLREVYRLMADFTAGYLR